MPRMPRMPRTLRPSLSVWRLASWLLLAAGAGCSTLPPGPPATPASPAAPTTAAAPTTPIAATAHPLATQAALAMLAQGGSAVDAAVAAQMVLGLVEPQSSGLGGGTMALYWDAATGQLSSLDGLAAAPARATAALTIDTDGSPIPADAVRRGPRSVGVPGTLALFAQLHRQHGRLPWAALFTPAITLAEAGVAMPPYLHGVLAATPPERWAAPMRALYLGADGRLLPVGATLRNPAYATTLRRIAAQGAAGWLAGGGAQALVAALQQGQHPGLVNTADVLAYRAQPRAPLCRPVLQVQVCVMGPASFGGVAVLQMLQMLEAGDVTSAGTSTSAAISAATPAAAPTAKLASFNFDNPAFVHRFVEVGRMAQADRVRHVGDPAFWPVPLAELLDADYLRQRAARIQPQQAMPPVSAGSFGSAPQTMPQPAPEHGVPADTTSQIAIVDGTGNALSITTTVNLNFGAWVLVDGYVLNNAMTNFSAAPPPGQQRANQMAPGKRPVTSMVPTIVLDAQGKPLLVGGSAGGGQIVDYVAASLIELLAAGRSPAQALARGHVSTAVAGTVQLEQGTAAATQADALRALGHQVTVTEMRSGLAFLQRTPAGWVGAADPRRDGVAASLRR